MHRESKSQLPAICTRFNLIFGNYAEEKELETVDQFIGLMSEFECSFSSFSLDEKINSLLSAKNWSALSGVYFVTYGQDSICYVGQSNNMDRRLWQHLSDWLLIMKNNSSYPNSWGYHQAIMPIQRARKVERAIWDSEKLGCLKTILRLKDMTKTS